MARPRRLRYKLVLGLGLVFGSILLLVTGTLFGIRTYSLTMRTTDQKMQELELVSHLIEILKGPDQQTAAVSEVREFEQSLALAGEKLAEFRNKNAETVALGLDPDGGDKEAGLIAQLETSLSTLHGKIKEWSPAGENEAYVPLRLKPHVKPHYDEARRCTEHLRLAIIHDIQIGIKQSNKIISRAVWVVRFATAWAVLLLLTLMYYFRKWLFNPIRELQAGIARVHNGDFEHPIELNLEPEDELRGLAEEFNAMTARLGATYADLARQVNERSRQLVRSERMVSVGFLAAGVAHEINNPLASILFCSEALERRLKDVLAEASAAMGHTPADAEVISNYLGMVQREALRCKDITTRLLDFSRTGERKRDNTDMGALVRGVLEVARLLPNCRGKNIQFDPKEYIVAQVNSQDLKSVILNLMVNALDSMDENGTLAIALGTSGDAVQMSFTDSGCGMTPDVLENIFEPFFTKSRTGKGTGLGLFISHQIIDQHGGTIEATSAGPGHGSTFTVRVPIRDAGAPEPAAAPEPVVLPFPGARAA